MWLVFSGVSFALATLAAFRQPERENPLRPTETMWQWFTHPIERNSWRKLPGLSQALTDIFFRDNRHGWAAGDSLLATSDGGASWSLTGSDSDPFAERQSIFFPDADHGWVVGPGRAALTTSDGGATWRSVDIPAPFGALQSIYFLDSVHGWIVGNSGAIMTTNDGGTSWKGPSSITPAALQSVYFSDAAHGWTVGTGGTILATSDGGANWKIQPSSTQQELNSVHFVDARRGWAAGATGVILSTQDGGVSWTQQTSGTFQELYSLHFLDGSHGIVVGKAGTILATSDGGRQWTRRSSGVRQTLYSVRFTDASHGWAVGEYGRIIATTDGGTTWNPLTIPSPMLFAMDFVDDRHGWAVGYGGLVLSTQDGGKNWKTQDSGTARSLFAVHFLDATHGWAAGFEGVIIATNDGGISWEPESLPLRSFQSLSAIYFLDIHRGWAAGDGGRILTTKDGGASWTDQTIRSAQAGEHPSMIFASMYFPDSNHGWVVGDQGTIVATADGDTWRDQSSGTTAFLNGVYFADSNQGWAVGTNGVIVATADGGAHWQRQVSGTDRELYSVHFADSRHGWVVGATGTVLATSDGGTTWETKDCGTSNVLRAVHFADANRGWIAGLEGTILGTNNGGQTWERLGAPARYPAPWYYAALILSLVLAVPGLKVEDEIVPADSAANRQVSDNPIGPGDLDALGLGEIALGLSQFFRNLDTKPPLTVGILGEWGQGKSSVMRLLEVDLRKNSVHAVWFNAWHYQKEDHLLAYLLEAIRKQAVPKLQTLHGLRFRIRLLGLRGAKDRWTAAALLLLVAFCIGLLQHSEFSGRLGGWSTSLLSFSPDALKQLTVLGFSLGTFLLASRQIYGALKAFHVNPASLIKQAAGSISIKDLGEKTSLRMAFASEFNDVTRALEPYRLVIFIDDLDRCNPGSVTQVLEAINFLTSAGDCFVVMGLAKKQVEASVGLSFKDVAEEMGTSVDAKEKRRTYAEQYLRKLINLEVKVPTATEEQQRLLLAGQAADERVRVKSYAERLAGFARANQPIAWAAISVALAVAAFQSGRGFVLPEAPKQVISDSAPTPPPIPAQTPTPNRAVTPTPRPAPKPTPSGPALVEGSREVRHLTWLPVIPSLLLLGFTFWILTRRPNEIIRDSKNFTEALEIWQPVIGRQYETPREIKRFLNRVRYIAMRWRRPLQQNTLFEQAMDWIQNKISRVKIAPAETSEIDEAGIVMMAAVEGLGGKKALADEKNDRDMIPALIKHHEKFGDNVDWQRFREITGEVEAN
jgi:photosystem II stability/assembly factor-like uncharacterized protein